MNQDALFSRDRIEEVVDAANPSSPCKSPRGAVQPRLEQTTMQVKPCAREPKLDVGFGGDHAAVQHLSDGPQVVANLRPFEAPPRANTLRRTPKVAASQNPSGDPVPAVFDRNAEAKSPSVEVVVAALPKGWGYIFGVEAKHSRGVVGGVGEWSAPLFTKLIEFECTPRQLNLEIDARFGTLLFKASAVTTAHPHNEHITLEAPAVNFADEHRELSKNMGLPSSDPWPLSTAAQLGKYVVKSKGRSAYAERLEVDGDLSLNHLPEQRPHGDDYRDALLANHADNLKR